MITQKVSKTSVQYDAVVHLCLGALEEFLTNKNLQGWKAVDHPTKKHVMFALTSKIVEFENTGKNISNCDKYLGMFHTVIMFSVFLLEELERALPDDGQEVVRIFEKHMAKAKELMENKNHDYGEAWRNMRVSSMTDLARMKLLRINQIETNDGHTIISEGVDANYYDIINYCIFALIKTLDLDKVMQNN